MTEELAKHLQELVSDGFEIDGHLIRIGLSIGIAIYPFDGPDAATLLINGDAALARAKRDGRGSLGFFEAAMDQQLRERRALQHELGSALEHDQLKLFFQPQAGSMARSSASRRCCAGSIRCAAGSRPIFHPARRGQRRDHSDRRVGSEGGLPRGCTWPPPRRTSPSTCRRSSSSRDLAGAGARRCWRPAGAASPGAGDHRRRPDRAIRAVARSILRRLKALGVSIALDDFGTGYSSLRLSPAFPVDKIKIDQSFVICSVERAVPAIVRAVIGLAKASACR